MNRSHPQWWMKAWHNYQYTVFHRSSASIGVIGCHRYEMLWTIHVERFAKSYDKFIIFNDNVYHQNLSYTLQRLHRYPSTLFGLISSGIDQIELYKSSLSSCQASSRMVEGVLRPNLLYACSTGSRGTRLMYGQVRYQKHLVAMCFEQQLPSVSDGQQWVVHVKWPLWPSQISGPRAMLEVHHTANKPPNSDPAPQPYYQSLILSKSWPILTEHTVFDKGHPKLTTIPHQMAWLQHVPWRCKQHIPSWVVPQQTSACFHLALVLPVGWYGYIGFWAAGFKMDLKWIWGNKPVCWEGWTFNHPWFEFMGQSRSNSLILSEKVVQSFEYVWNLTVHLLAFGSLTCLDCMPCVTFMIRHAVAPPGMHPKNDTAAVMISWSKLTWSFWCLGSLMFEGQEMTRSRPLAPLG